MDYTRTHTRPEPRANEGWWWRFERYELQGEWICPKNTKKVELFDPWVQFTSLRGHRARQGHRPDSPGSLQPPYMELVRLVKGLAFDPEKPRYPDKLTPASQQAILNWCERHGPLGVLLSRWESITLERQPDGQGNWIERSYWRGVGQDVEIREKTGDVDPGGSKVVIRNLKEISAKKEEP